MTLVKIMAYVQTDLISLPVNVKMAGLTLIAVKVSFVTSY